VCLAAPERSSVEIWQQDEDRSAMKEAVYHLPEPEKMWQKFLEFNKRITHTILKECQQNNISVCIRNESESVDHYADRIAKTLEIQ
jgi:uncharacterized protein YmfQ (DUF2313 family)